MAPKRKRKPAAKATAAKPAKASSTPTDPTVLPNGTKVSKRPTLVARGTKRKPTARRGATATKPDPSTETQLPGVLPAGTDPPSPPESSTTRTCRACGISKPCTDSTSEFPSHEDLPACKHPQHRTCRACLVSHIASLWAQRGLKKLTCPECRAPVQLRSVETFCGPQIRDKYHPPPCPGHLPTVNSRLTASIRYVALAGADCAEVYPSWRWCLYPPCTAGQSHFDPGDPVVTCDKCGFKTCFKHRVPWHEEYTCAEFDNKAAVDVERSEKYIRFSMARCPHCGFYVEKVDGCNNMQCRCGVFFRYVTGMEGVRTTERWES